MAERFDRRNALIGMGLGPLGLLWVPRTALARTRAPQRGERAAQGSKASLPDEYATKGLDALAAAHRGGWSDGHHGAAVLAAYLFSRENDLDADVVRSLRREIDAYTRANSQYFPPASQAGSGADERAGRTETLRSLLKDRNPHPEGAGHDVIYAALALRVLRAFPELATRGRIDGISRLLQLFWRRFRGPTGGIPHPGTAEYADTREMARTTLRRFVAPHHLPRSGPTRPVALIHWITHAEALMTLDELGYREESLRGFGVLERATRHSGEVAPEERLVLKPAVPSSSLTAAFWDHPAVREGGWLFGHSFKFPYSLHRLSRHADEPALEAPSLERARLLVANGVVG